MSTAHRTVVRTCLVVAAAAAVCIRRVARLQVFHEYTGAGVGRLRYGFLMWMLWFPAGTRRDMIHALMRPILPWQQQAQASRPTNYISNVSAISHAYRSLKCGQLDKVIDLLDADGSGTIEVEELLDVILPRGSPCPYDQVPLLGDVNTFHLPSCDSIWPNHISQRHEEAIRNASTDVLSQDLFLLTLTLSLSLSLGTSVCML